MRIQWWPIACVYLSMFILSLIANQALGFDSFIAKTLVAIPFSIAWSVICFRSGWFGE